MKKLYIFIVIPLTFTLNSFSQNMGIGTATPQEKLDIQGAIKIGNTSANNEGTIKYDASAQKFQVNIAGSWCDIATGTGAAISTVTYNASTNVITAVEGSNTFTVNLSDLEDNTDNQTVSLSGNSLVISNGNSVDLSPFLDNTDEQTLSVSGNDLSISGGNTVSLAGFANTDNQTLSLSTNNLAISGGNSVSLASYVNTDNQTLSLSANTLAISGGNNVSLGPYLDNTDAQTLSLSGNTLSISGGNNVSLASFANTDNQTLSLSGNTLAISGGNNVSLSPYLDNTDAQTLSLSGSTLSISGGNNISLASFADTDDQTLSEVYQEGGNAVQLTAANGDIRFYRGTNTDVLTMRESTAFVGIGTSTPITNLNLVSTNETTLLNLMQTTLDKSGLLITTEYGTDVYTPGLFWNTNNNNSTKPKAGIFLQLSGTGSRLVFGTSNSYSTGITNSAMMINEVGNVTLSSMGGTGNVLVTANNSGQLGKTALSGSSTDVLTGTGTFTSISTLVPSDWVRSGTNLYPSSTTYNVGIGTSVAARKLHVESGGQISLLQSGTVGTDSQAGIYWHTNDDYGIYRSSGSWNSPNYQQLTARWVTGIVLDPGNSYGKSYVDITGGGLRVTSGTVGVGVTSPSQQVHASGNIQLDGRRVYFGSDQNLYGDNSSALYWNGAHTNTTQIILRDAEDTQYGRVYGNGDGTNFGLMDGDGNWSYLAAKDSYTAFRINNSEKVRITSGGNVGIGTTSPDEKLEVNGYIKSKGVINTDGTVTESEVTAKRYHVVSRYGTNTRSTVPLDMNIIVELCGDEDGCMVRGLMRKWSNNTQTEAASRGPYIFTYNDADGHWRLYDNTGVDGSGGTQHVWQWWDCYLTDGNYSNGSNLGDPGKGLGLLNWNSDYSYTNKTCEITFVD